MSLTTAVWFGAELLDVATVPPVVVQELHAALHAHGATRVVAASEEAGVVHAVFDDAAAAVEAAVVAQWNVQKMDDPGLKLRVGVHASADDQAATAGSAAVASVANGNQILASGSVDQATGGVLDARPMGMIELATEGPVQLWLMTDSRPDVDRRPLNLPD